MQIARLTTYDLCKAEIVRYAEAIRSRAREEGPAPMDLSSLQSKGKGKGKGSNDGNKSSTKCMDVEYRVWVTGVTTALRPC
eukprot:2434106-Amphidinium_carterae.1